MYFFHCQSVLLNSESKGNSVTLLHGRSVAGFGLLVVCLISLLTHYARYYDFHSDSGGVISQ